MVETRQETRLPYKALDEFTYGVLVRLGVPPEDARITADALSQANLRGVDSHGIDLLPMYVERLRSGMVKPQPRVRVVKETPAMALIDGDRGLGQVTAVFGMKLAIEKARQVGIGWINVFNSSHQGALAYYALMAVKKDMIGMTTSTTSRTTSPWGSRERISPNSPVAFAVPTRNYKTLVLDMATSVRANGIVRLAKERNIPLPEGLAIDIQGNVTTDPFKAASTLPFGTYKGSGLAMVFAILAGLLGGGPLVGYASQRVNEGGPFVPEVGHLLVAVDIKSFTDVDEFKSKVDDAIATWKRSAKRPGFEEIYYPGEIEWNRVRDRESNGIPLNDSLVNELRKLAEELEVPFPVEA